MSFSLDELDGPEYLDRRPEVYDEAIKGCILQAVSNWDVDDLRIKVGSVWDRKGYPESGSLSKEVRPSSYRTSFDQVYVTVEVLLEDWEKLDGLDEARAEQLGRHLAATEAEKQAKLDKARELREQADRLESEAGR